MKEENKRANIKDELARAEEAKKSADLLAQEDHLLDAVSRLYYSLFYTVRALLLTKGLEPKTHDGALTLFSLHFVKSGTFASADAHLFSRLMKYREEADYNPAYIFTKRDYSGFKQDAEKLRKTILEYLKRKSYA